MPKTSGNVGLDDFFHPLLSFVMTCNEHDMLNMFLMLKPQVFYIFQTKYAYEFILGCCERFHKIAIVHQHGVEFVIFKLQSEPCNGRELIWNGDLLLYHHLFGTNFMSCF